MNILHINNYLKKGGAEIIFTVTSLNPIHKHYLGFYSENTVAQKSDINFSSWESKGFPFNFFNYVFSISNYLALSKFLKKTDINIIHLHGFFSSLSPSILLAIRKIKKNKKIKVLQTLHEFHPICPNASLFNFNKNKICEKCIGKKIKYNIFLENCDKRGIIYSIIKGIRSFISNNFLNHKEVIDIFISPSYFLKEKVINDSVIPDKIMVIPNPIRTTTIEEIGEKEEIICYFGRFSYEKNIPFLINAFSQWKMEKPNNYKLLLIGEGDENQKILESKYNSNFSNSIEIKPYLDYPELINELKKCKLFSISSLCYENSPLSIAEAIALDIIPIAPSLGGMKESIEYRYNAGKTYITNDKSSWIHCVNHVINNYNDEIKKVFYAKKIIAEQYSIEKYYKRINELYDTLR